jgi:hypothetical protein
MTIIISNHITSSGCGSTSILCIVDIEKKEYNVQYESNWMGMSEPVKYTISGEILYVDYMEKPFTFHAYLCYKPKKGGYMSAIIEIISFPKLRECVPGTREHEKYCMSTTSDEFNVNGIILAEVCQDVDENSREVELVKTLNGCSLQIIEKD